MKSTKDNNPDNEDETPKKNPFDGGGVKGATLSTENKDISFEEDILKFDYAQYLWCIIEL